jgi:hypothetical protein
VALAISVILVVVHFAVIASRTVGSVRGASAQFKILRALDVVIALHNPGWISMLERRGSCIEARRLQRRVMADILASARAFEAGRTSIAFIF